jgi:magnesium-transporting ATPase (P-type)
MMKTKLFIHAFILLALVGVLNLTAIHLYLYWTTNWFDMIVHTLAGATVGMTMILFWQYRHMSVPLQSLDQRHLVRIGVIGAIVIGILWEIYELSFGITTLADGIHYFTDTGSDLICDTIGGILGSLYAYRLIKNTKPQTV